MVPQIVGHMPVGVGEETTPHNSQLLFKIPLCPEYLFLSTVRAVNTKEIARQIGFPLVLSQGGVHVIPAVIANIEVVVINRFLPPVVVPLVASGNTRHIEHRSCLRRGDHKRGGRHDLPAR